MTADDSLLVLVVVALAEAAKVLVLVDKSSSR